MLLFHSMAHNMAACLPREETETKVNDLLQAVLGNIFHYITIFYLLEESPYSYSHTDLHEYHGTEIFGAIFKSVHCTTQIYIKDSKINHYVQTMENYIALKMNRDPHNILKY